MKLIQAFQTGSKEDADELISHNTELIKLNKNQGPIGPSDLHVLHIAVQIAPLDEVRHLLSKYKDAPAFDINTTEPLTGNTPLHVAAKYGRSDIVMYLLSFDDVINDTALNSQGKQPVEVARTPELAEAMQVVRAQYVEKVATRMKQYFNQNNVIGLEELLSNPRSATLLDINGQDPDTGSTVLHDFVKARNIPMVEFILSHGGDPLRRNSKGILPVDLTKDDTLKRMLKKSTKSQQVLLQSAGMSPIALQNRGKHLTSPSSDTLATSSSARSTSQPGTALEDSSDHPSLLGPPPTMKGFLKKWTNFTGGYKLRWFVLENNVLSYYKRQTDTESACRGSINMRQARLHVDSTEKLQFEVLSGTSVKFHLKANHPVETGRWVWALTNAIQYAKDQEKLKNAQFSHRRYQSGTSNIVNPFGDANNASSSLALESQFSPSASHFSNSGSQITTTAPTHNPASSISSVNAISATGGALSSPSHPQSVLNEDWDRASLHSQSVARLVQLNNNAIEHRDKNINFDKEDDEEDDDDDDDEDLDIANKDEPPYTAEIRSAEDSISVGLESVEQVIKSLFSMLNRGSLSPDELKSGLGTLEQALMMISTLVRQYTSHVSTRELYFKTKLDRNNQLQELWTQSIHDLEVEKGKVQEELHKAIQKKRQANKVLREVAGSPMSKRASIVYPRRSSIFGQQQQQQTGAGEIGKDEDISALVGNDGVLVDVDGLNERLQQINIESESESELEDEFFDALGSDEGYTEEPTPANVISQIKVSKEVPSQTQQKGLEKTPEKHVAQPLYPPPPPPPSSSSHPPSTSQNIPTSEKQPLEQAQRGPTAVNPEEEKITGQQPQLGETTKPSSAHTQGIITPQMKTHEGIISSTAETTSVTSAAASTVAPSILQKEALDDLTDSQRQKLNAIVNDDSFVGYEDGPRKRLALSADDRPKISLWGVLKNLIGKDMTRMTLPVSFNECTNLLQRSAEDMEYTHLLDKAAAIVDDPGERMAYIAAFAASSYSSTTERVAKPFNPLLGETFEYTRPDMGYRMFSEQVSHHPPIGALVAESPRWDFYGASNVKSKFYGRSFDINPLGLWYITLRPNKGSGVEEEVYSFRKVTSSVVGIITGNPVVDNYGDMEIINYTLGYRCSLKFKARGWRDSGAFELRGTVYNKEDEPQWVIGGRWNDRIFGKKVGGDDVNMINSGKVPDLGEKSSRLLLWKVHERPRAPFNLTPFAITLNALPERLGAWIAPTDTRLRPDQRAMEEGRYDDAADDKHRVEEKQRAARRERERDGTEYKPLWFVKAIHEQSGEEYWKYQDQYWPKRSTHNWENVPEIF